MITLQLFINQYQINYFTYFLTNHKLIYTSKESYQYVRFVNINYHKIMILNFKASLKLIKLYY